MILQHLLPYFIYYLQDDSPLVKVEAGESGLELLEEQRRRKEGIVLVPTDYKLFQVYIFPEYRKLGGQGNDYIQTTFMSLMGKLATLGKHYLELQILNEDKYFREMTTIDQTPRVRRKVSQDTFLELHSSITDFEVEADQIANQLIRFALDAFVKTDTAFLSPIVSHLAE